MLPIKIEYIEKDYVKMTFAKDQIRIKICPSWVNFENGLKVTAEEIYLKLREIPCTLRGYIHRFENKSNTIEKFYFYLCFNHKGYQNRKGYAKVTKEDNVLYVDILDDENKTYIME